MPETKGGGGKGDATPARPKNKGGKNRSRGRRNKTVNANAKNNNNNKNNAKKPVVPHAPQTKVTFRHVQNVDANGNVAAMLALVQRLMDDCVSQTNVKFEFAMDRVAGRRLVEQERAVSEARTQFLRSLQQTDEQQQQQQNEQSAHDAAVGEANAVTNSAANTKDTKNDDLEIAVAAKKPSNLPVITVRPLYVVPPKKTQRRGERGGHMYMVFVAPKIEAKPAVSTPVNGSGSNGSQRNGVKGKATKKLNNNQADYTKELAKGRLLLLQSIQALSEHAKASRTPDDKYSSCIVEESMSGKTWRHQGRPDRRKGSVETSADYRAWMQSQKQLEEDLSARPKPAPGGGITTGASGEGDGEEEVSALVLHLRAKREEERIRKEKKKEEKAEKAKAVKNKKTKKAKKKNTSKQQQSRSQNNGSSPAATAAAAAAGKQKKDKSGKNKAKKKKGGTSGKNGENSSSKAVVAPKLLKPSAAG